jgi:hypothetical protein
MPRTVVGRVAVIEDQYQTCRPASRIHGASAPCVANTKHLTRGVALKRSTIPTPRYLRCLATIMGFRRREVRDSPDTDNKVYVGPSAASEFRPVPLFRRDDSPWRDNAVRSRLRIRAQCAALRCNAPSRVITLHKFLGLREGRILPLSLSANQTTSPPHINRRANLLGWFAARPRCPCDLRAV